MGTIALNANWDIRLEPESVSSDAFTKPQQFPMGNLVTMKLTTGCDTVTQAIKQNILSNDLSIFYGDVNPEFVSGIIKSSILDVDGVISLTSFSAQRTSLSGVLGGFSIRFTANTTCGQISSSIG